MMDQPPLPRAIWDTLSPDAQAAVTALVQSFERRIADLEERLGKDSTWAFTARNRAITGPRPKARLFFNAERGLPRQ
jgi:hypothetical protein